METILAVDLKKGKVVRAFAGFRSNYKPLKSTKYNLESPVNFINKVLTLLAISKVYVADLDSIQNSGSNFDLISKLLNTFQHLTFLIDNGFDYPKSVKTFCEKLKKKNLYNFIPVVGTENLRNYNFQSYTFLPNIVYLPLILPFSTDSKIKLFFSIKKLSIKLIISSSVFTFFDL